MALEKKKRGMGCIAGKPDHRDRLYIPKLSAEADIFPIDLRSECNAVRNQGELGSCTAFGVTELFDFVRKKHKLTSWVPSALFTYYATRQLTNQTDEDCGATVRNALKSTVKSGVARERVWPYNISKFNQNPPQEIWDDAEKHQTLEYLNLSSFDKNVFVKCLNEGYPFAFGINVYESFLNSTMRSKGFIPAPDITKEQRIGGHCMLAVGYKVDDDGKEYMIVQNSWGQYWGDGGYCYIPLEYFLTSAYDFWTIRLTEVCDSDEPDPVPVPEPTPVPPAPVPVPEPTPVPVPVPVPPTPVVVPDLDSKPNLWKKFLITAGVFILIAIIQFLFRNIR